MKKIITIFSILLISAILIIFNITYARQSQPGVGYLVYLNGELIGKIKEVKELEKYINKEQQEIKDLYKVSSVYLPNGLEIKKKISYDNDYDSIETIYNIIRQKSNFTVEGYQVTINSHEQSYKIYVLDEKIFDNSVENVIKAYVGTKNYEDYISKNQDDITSTGQYINNIYVDNDITIKKTLINSTETIYLDSKNLSNYLLFGDLSKNKIYTVKAGDTIESISSDNKISVEEFLMSNTKYKQITNILSVGEEVTIGVTEPKLNVTVERRNVADTETMYKTIEKYDSSLVVGYSKVTQEGKKGITRVTQDEKIVNGEIVYINPVSKEEIKPAEDKVVAMGTKVIPSVGNTSSWVWPTESGWTISCPYGWRIHPIYHNRHFHNGLDIAGTGYGSKVFASNNGVVVEMSRNSSEGIYVTINHNNGYYTRYLHLSRYASNLSVGQIVSAGQVIAYVGSTGDSTGPHLHFSVWYGMPYKGGTVISPWTLFR